MSIHRHTFVIGIVGILFGPSVTPAQAQAPPLADPETKPASAQPQDDAAAKVMLLFLVDVSEFIDINESERKRRAS